MTTKAPLRPLSELGAFPGRRCEAEACDRPADGFRSEHDGAPYGPQYLCAAHHASLPVGAFGDPPVDALLSNDDDAPRVPMRCRHKGCSEMTDSRFAVCRKCEDAPSACAHCGARGRGRSATEPPQRLELLEQLSEQMQALTAELEAVREGCEEWDDHCIYWRFTPEDLTAELILYAVSAELRPWLEANTLTVPHSYCEPHGSPSTADTPFGLALEVWIRRHSGARRMLRRAVSSCLCFVPANNMADVERNFRRNCLEHMIELISQDMALDWADKYDAAELDAFEQRRAAELELDGDPK